jgi:hypothetical protein
LDYSVKASAYVGRARKLLDSNTPEGLIYAALEIRCGVEARLKEYFDAYAETAKRKREGWRIAKLAKQVEEAFKARNKVIRLVIFDAETKELIREIAYTPVTKRLQKLGEKLGDYLHSQEERRLSSEPFWINLRAELEVAYDELKFATSGELMAPPLEHPRNAGQSFFCVEGDQRQLFPSGRKIGMRFEHYEITYDERM